MILHAEGNQLFFNNEEVRESSSSAREGGPAHYHRIAAIGSSPKGTRIVSVDEGGQLKVWAPVRRNMEQRVWNGQGFGGATAVCVTDDGKRFVIAIGRTVTVYEIEPGVREPRRLDESATLPLAEKVVFLQFTDDDHVICSDNGGKKVIFGRDSVWRVKRVEA